MNGGPFPFASSIGRRAADFFRQQAAAHAQRGRGDPQQQEPPQAQPQQQQRHPPASRRAVRQLPTVVVAPEDLVDPNNRECCICLEENHLKARMIRLPCAHIFHPHCIVDWLCKSNTCPVCRYELETEDHHYETIRMERMRHRKPRYALYELQRMPIRELKQLGERLRVNLNGCMEKQEMVTRLVESERLDVIAAPEPVEYPLSLLRAMGIGELKRCMGDAGVFFDPIDVVEKEDMVQIFIASGRLVIVAERTAETTTSTTDGTVVVEEKEEYVFVAETPVAPDSGSRKRSHSSDHSGTRNDRVPIVTTVGEDDSDDDNSVGSDQQLNDESNQLPQSNPLMEEVVPNGERVASVSRESGDNVTENKPSTAQVEDDVGMDQSSDSATEQASLDEYKQQQSVPDEMVGSPMSIDDEYEDAEEQVVGDEVDTGETHFREQGTETAATANVEDSEMQVDEPEQADEDVATDYPVLVGRHAYSTASAETGTPPTEHEYASAGTSNHSEDSHYFERSISDLQALARQMNIDITDCIERHEIIARLVRESTGRSDARLEPNDFATWSVSELRALAREVNVDLSNCTDRITMIAMLMEAANERPRLSDYLSALMPLARLTIPQLRAVGREWQVNLSDCIEKEEMIHRLVIAGGPST